MLTKIIMPSGGTNTDQLLVVSWKKNVGDAVKRGDILMEVETDKAVLEVESFAKGTLLKRLVEEGSYGTVGDVVAYIGKPEDLNELDEAPVSSKPVTEDLDDFTPIVVPPPAKIHTAQAIKSGLKLSSNRQVKATPAAKKSVRDRGLDLGEVYRRVGKDILRSSDVAQLSGESAISPNTTSATGDVMASEVLTLTPMRRRIAERMQAASSVPAFTAEVEVDMSGCIRLRSDLNQYFKGTKFGYHDLIAKCAAIAAGDYPLVNASFTDKGLRLFHSVNIGLAVSLEQGLVVPVVCDVRGKDIASLAQENARNIEQVRSGKFNPNLLENGTFTISNLGKYPISRFTAILNPPQSCILAIGAIQSRAVWANGQFREQPTASITGTFDHRVVDGSYGVEFLTRLKELLEHPHLLFIR